MLAKSFYVCVKFVIFYLFLVVIRWSPRRLADAKASTSRDPLLTMDNEVV